MATKPTCQAESGASLPPLSHIMNPTSPLSAAEDLLAPSLSELLVRSAVGLRDRVAVQALVEEGELLGRDNVRTALVMKQNGVMTCCWEGVAKRTHILQALTRLAGNDRIAIGTRL